MAHVHRSRCPINLAVEVIGDRWTLLVLRDMVFGGKRHYREFLDSDEGISTNILADRLTMLTANGLLTKADDPSHKRKAIYSLTESGIALVPVLAQIGIWGRHHRHAAAELSRYAEELERGGPGKCQELMDDLTEIHLGQ